MHRALVLASCLSATGCVMETTTTTIQIRDPSAVSLSTSKAETAPLALGPGREHDEKLLAAGRFQTSLGGSSDYSLRASRASDGSIDLTIDTKVALANGEHQQLLRADGKIALSEVTLEQIGQAGRASSPTFSYDGCASLWRQRSGYVFSTMPPCGGDLVVPYTLQTPWSNVVEVREHREPDRGIAIAAILLASITFVLPGAILTSVGRGPNGDDPAQTIGEIFLGVGVGLDLLAVPTLFASSSDRVVELPVRPAVRLDIDPQRPPGAF